MPDSRVIGVECKAYRNTGTYGTPTWTEVTIVGDATISGERPEADMAARGDVVAKFRVGILRWQVEFDLVYQNGHAGYDAIRDAFLNKTVLDMLFLDGASGTTDNEGLRSELYFTNFGRVEPMEDKLTVPVTGRPADTSNAPTWYTVA